MTRTADLYRTARQAAGLSQPEAAARAGVSVGTWSRLERGVKSTIDSLVSMALAVDITPDQLRSAGQSEAADVLKARLKNRSGSFHAVPDTHPFGAVIEAQKVLLEAGWALSVEPDGDGGYTFTIKRP